MSTCGGCGGSGCCCCRCCFLDDDYGGLHPEELFFSVDSKNCVVEDIVETVFQDGCCLSLCKFRHMLITINVQEI